MFIGIQLFDPKNSHFITLVKNSSNINILTYLQEKLFNWKENQNKKPKNNIISDELTIDR